MAITVRIIADSDDEPHSPVPPPRQRGDYAALLKRGRAGRAAIQAEPDARAGESGNRNDAVQATHAMAQGADDLPLAINPLHLADYMNPFNDAQATLASSHTEVDQRSQRQQVDIAPYLDALVERQYDFMQLVDFLVKQIEDFCTDPAVLSQGEWQTRIKFDPALLPDCILDLRLSHFDLTLLFETAEARSQRLILDHSEVLKSRLEALLVGHGMTHSVGISIE